MKLDVGGGRIPREGHVNLDPVHGEGAWKRRAQDTPWPTGDGTVEAVCSSHCLEHVPAGAERIAVFNEAHRVLVPGGIFEVRVPAFPGSLAVADPTHVSFWVAESFWYFTGRLAADADYGISIWSEDVIDAGWEIRAVLRKPEG